MGQFCKSYLYVEYENGEVEEIQSVAEGVDKVYTFDFVVRKHGVSKAYWKMILERPTIVKLQECMTENGEKIQVFPIQKYNNDVYLSKEVVFATKIKSSFERIIIKCWMDDVDFDVYASYLETYFGIESKATGDAQLLNMLLTNFNILKQKYRANPEQLKEFAEREQQIDELANVHQVIYRELLEFEDKNEKLQQEISDIKDENNNLQNTVEELKEQISNKNSHIEQLLQVERDFENVKHSKAGRIIYKWWGAKDKMIPPGSKRKFVAKTAKKFAKHPVYMLKKCTPSRIKRTLHYMRTEDGAMMEARLDMATTGAGSDIVRISVDLEPELKGCTTVADFKTIVLHKYEDVDVSIVIPVYNQFYYTYNCIKSITKHTQGINYEVILADDCSTDITKDVSKIIKNIVVSKTPENLRFLKNCNLAASKARGKYIFFLNNDTQVQDKWLSSLIELIESDEKIGMVGSMLLYPDGSLQEAGGILWKDASAWNFGNQQSPLNPEFNYVRETDYISGAAIMIRTSLWNEIGGFDEIFAPAYCEDSDLAMEVRKHGYKVMYQPLSKVVHFEGVSNGTDVNAGVKKYQVVNQSKFHKKWKDVLEKENFPNAEELFLAKDRSRNKKHILVVDHYVPEHDKDAGGKTTFMYLQLFVRMGMKVTFIGDNFNCSQPYTTELNQLGIEVLYGRYYSEHWKDWIKENGKYFDYVYLQRPHISIKYIDIMKEYTNAKIFYYAHDLHHIREYREYELTHDPVKLKESEKWKKIEYELFTKADVGHVVGSYEEKLMQEALPGNVIRGIPAYMYDKKLENIEKNFDRRKDIMFVGGFGHPPNKDAVLWFANSVFPQVVKKYPDMIFYVMGSKVPEEIKNLENSNIKILGFVSDEKLEEMYRKCRMSIVPLRVGAGVKGKVVEAAYFQIPLITTSIGAEGLDDTMGNMIVEDDANEMARAIIDLYENYDMLKKMSDAGEKFIKKYFTYEEAERVLRLDLDPSNK